MKVCALIAALEQMNCGNDEVFVNIAYPNATYFPVQISNDNLSRTNSGKMVIEVHLPDEIK